jgi:hypothetical protein
MIQLTSTILKNMYTMLVVCKPFDKWDMPLPEQIKFIVDHDPDTMGTFLYDDGADKYEHVITISAARCGFLDTVIRTMAHEMIHASRWNTSTAAWQKHDKVFRSRAFAVSQSMGFDPLEL